MHDISDNQHFLCAMLCTNAAGLYKIFLTQFNCVYNYNLLQIF